MAGEKGVLVVGELSDGQLASITRELLTAGRGLADALGEPLVAFLAGAEVPEEAARSAIASGADRVRVAEHPLIGEPVNPYAFRLALEQAVRQVDPTVVLLGRTALGRDVGPCLAFGLGVGMAQDCVELEMQEGRLVAVRPVYGGTAMARVALSQRPFIATVRPKVYEPEEPDPSRTGEVERLEVALSEEQIPVKVKERVAEEVTGPRLETARVVVGGGRGLGGPEPFRMLEELARLLGGAVGASRAVCDAGWLPHSYQIGLTGKTITADLYIAVGISGASQHMAGVSTVKTIVAINKDPDAPIFKEARFGVVGDWQKVLPAFMDEVRKLVSE